MFRQARRIACSALLAFVGSTARAAPPAEVPERVRVVLTVAPSAESACPKKAELEAAVLARLGYDPFAADAPRVAVIDVTADGPKLVAHVRLVDAGDQVRGSREIPGSVKACTDLFDSIALSLAIAIDPLSNGERRTDASPPPPSPAPDPRPSDSRPPDASPVESPPPNIWPTAPPREVARVGVGAIGSIGSAPFPTVGVVISAEVPLARELVHLGVEGRADLPARGDGPNGAPVASLLLGGLSGCFGRALLGCAIASMGVARLTSDGVESERVALPFFASVGARSAVDVTFEELAIRPYLEAQAILTPHTLRIDGEPRFDFPAVMAAFGVMAHFRARR